MEPIPNMPDRGGQAARAVALVAGLWLFVSAFAWPHAAAQRTNTWIMGLVIAGAAALVARFREARYVAALGGVWLFVSAFVLPTLHPATMWNNAIVAIVVFAATTVGFPSRTPLPPARA